MAYFDFPSTPFGYAHFDRLSAPQGAAQGAAQHK